MKRGPSNKTIRRKLVAANLSTAELEKQLVAIEHGIEHGWNKKIADENYEYCRLCRASSGISCETCTLYIVNPTDHKGVCCSLYTQYFTLPWSSRDKKIKSAVLMRDLLKRLAHNIKLIINTVPIK